MLVKEMRQGLKARTFVAVFLVIQLSMATSMFVSMLPETPGESRSLSSVLFWTVATALIVFVMPLRGLTALTSEFQDRTIELVLLTRLSAWRIVTGKWASLVLQTLLITVALLPYLVLRYFLGGVDVITETLILFLMLLASGWLCAIAIFTSSYKTWIGRVVLIGFQLWAVSVTISMLSNEFGNAIIDLAETKLVPILFVSWVAALLTLLILEFASGRIAPTAENHALRKRSIGLVLIAIQLVTLASDAAEAMLVVTCVALMLTFIDSLCEDVVETPSVYVPFVRIPVLGRVVGRFLYPGWPAGLWYSILLGSALLTELMTVFHIGGMHAAVMAASLFASLLLPAALKRSFKRGGAPIYYIAYFAGSALLAGLIGAVHAVMSPDASAEVIGFVPAFSLIYAAVGEIPPELQLPFLLLDGALVLYALVVLAVRSREEWRKIRAQEAKAIALHAASP
jgi:hypothetical protein